MLTFCVGNGQKKLSEAEQFFRVVWSQWQCSFYVWWRKNFSACEQFFSHTFRHIAVPHSIWLRVRVAQCAMALRVMVQHLGWPWDGHGSVHREHPQRGSRGLKALPSVTAPALAKPWHASAKLPSPQPNAVAEEICDFFFTGFHRLKKFFPLGTG